MSTCSQIRASDQSRSVSGLSHAPIRSYDFLRASVVDSVTRRMQTWAMTFVTRTISALRAIFLPLGLAKNTLFKTVDYALISTPNQAVYFLSLQLKATPKQQSTDLFSICEDWGGIGIVKLIYPA